MLRLYLKAETVFFFLITKGILFQSLDPFTLKDDFLDLELLHLVCRRELLAALRVETVWYSETGEKDQISRP